MSEESEEHWVPLDRAVMLLAKKHMTPLSGEWWMGMDLARNLIELRLASGLLMAKPKDHRQYSMRYFGIHPDGRTVDLCDKLKSSDETIPRTFWLHFRAAKRLSRGYPFTKFVKDGVNLVPIEEFDRTLPHARDKNGDISFLQCEDHLLDGTVSGEAMGVMIDARLLIHRPKGGRPKGKKFDDSQFLAEMDLLIRTEHCSDREAARRMVERYGSAIEGQTSDPASKAERLRKEYARSIRARTFGN